MRYLVMKVLFISLFFLAIHLSSLAADYISKDTQGPILPADLLDFYGHFVKATDTQNIKKLKSFLLPNTSEITTTPRDKNMEYGVGINLPFLKSRFSPLILSTSKTSDSIYALRTATSAISFVKTASGDWFIYRYLDKPIE